MSLITCCDAGHDVSVLDVSSRWRNPAARYRQADLFEADALAATVAGADFVFHLAGAADVNDVAADPVRAVRLNVEGTARVLDAARQAGAGRFVLASTVWVYGAAAGRGELTEDVPIDLRSPGHVYVATKLSAELLVHSYQEMFGQHYTILRYGIPYGPRMRDALVVARFVHAARTGEPIIIAGTGSSSATTCTSPIWPMRTCARCRTRPRTRRWRSKAAPRYRSGRSRTRCAAWSGRYRSGTPRRRAADYEGLDVSARLAKELLDWSPVTSFADWCPPVPGLAGRGEELAVLATPAEQDA